jgi:hypothetical protein
VTFGWTKTDAATICQARTDGAVAQLERILGPEPTGVDRANELLARAADPLRPEGRSLYAGQASLPLPDTTLGQVWRRGDMLREFRGDSHIAAWVSAGVDATEIGLLTELYWGMPTRTYVRTRAWTDAQLDAAEARLTEAGLMANHELTDAGREHREAIEDATDAQMAPAIEALGENLKELDDLLRPWATQVMDAGGYPQSPLAITR